MNNKAWKLLFFAIIFVLSISATALPAVAQGERVEIQIDAGKILAPVNPMLFGHNIGTGVNTLPEYLDFYHRAGVTLLRFPGGNFGDENDIYPSNMDDLAALQQELNAVVVVQTRSWRLGTPEKAAELVRYAKEKGYNFEYWEIGNEPELYARRDNQPGDPVFDVNWYSKSYREFYNAMKAVDPTIKIAGPVTTFGWPEWMPPFFYENGDIVDVISWHWYGHGNELTDEQVLANANDIERQVQTIRGMWQDPEINPKGYQRPLPPLLNSEYNVSAASSVKQQLGTQVAALWNAEVVGRMANLGVEMGAHFALQGTSWQGLIGRLEDPRPVYYVFEMFAQWGDRQISAQSEDDRMLPAFASLRQDGKMVLMVVNKNKDEARQAEISIKGFRPTEKAVVWTLANDHPLDPGGTAAAADRFSYEFQPYSVTLFIFDPVSGQDWRSLGFGFVVGLLLALIVRYFVLRRRPR